MAKHESKATLSRGRAGWCVIFRHPICRDRERGEKPLRVRRGLGTADEEQARKLVEEMNELLASHAVNPALLRADDFDAFFADRRGRLSKLVEAAMGKPVTEVPEDAEYENNGDAEET